MSTFVAHGLAGWTALEVARSVQPDEWQGRRWPWVFAALSILPDADSALCAVFGAQRMSVLEIGDGHDPHRALTHTLIFAVFAGGLASLFGARTLSRARWLRRWWCLSCAVALHPILDYLTANGAGMAFFYPFSRARFLSPLELLPIPGYSFSVRGLAGLLVDGNTWNCFAWETTTLVPLLLGVRLLHARSRGDSVGTFAAQRLTLTLLAAVSLASCYFAQRLTLQWDYAVRGLVRTLPTRSTVGHTVFWFQQMILLFFLLLRLVQITLPFILLIRGIRARRERESPKASLPMALVIAMLLAISSSALVARALIAWMSHVSRT